MRLIKIIIVFMLCFPVQAGDTDEAKKNILGKFTDRISNTFGGLTAFDGIKQAELEIDSKDKDFESDVRATIITSLWRGDGHGTIPNRSKS